MNNNYMLCYGYELNEHEAKDLVTTLQNDGVSVCHPHGPSALTQSSGLHDWGLMAIRLQPSRSYIVPLATNDSHVKYKYLPPDSVTSYIASYIGDPSWVLMPKTRRIFLKSSQHAPDNRGPLPPPPPQEILRRLSAAKYLDKMWVYGYELTEQEAKDLVTTLENDGFNVCHPHGPFALTQGSGLHDWGLMAIRLQPSRSYIVPLATNDSHVKYKYLPPDSVTSYIASYIGDPSWVLMPKTRRIFLKSSQHAPDNRGPLPPPPPPIAL